MKQKVLSILAGVILVLGSVFATASQASAEIPPGTQSCHFDFVNTLGWTTHSGDVWAYSVTQTKPAPGCFDVQVNHMTFDIYPTGPASQAVMQVETVNASGVHMAWGSQFTVHAGLNTYVILWPGMSTGQRFRFWSKVGNGSNTTGDYMD